MTSWISLFVFIVVTASAAVTGSMFQPGTFYEGLTKPGWTPPAWLFGPVWTAIYIMIVVSGWLIWREQGVSIVLAVWAFQLILNALWSFLAFELNRLDLAFLNIAALWISILLFIVLAWPISQWSATLFVPYVIWVSFAGALNFALWRLNP